MSRPRTTSSPAYRADHQTQRGPDAAARPAIRAATSATAPTTAHVGADEGGAATVDDGSDEVGGAAGMGHGAKPR